MRIQLFRVMTILSFLMATSALQAEDSPEWKKLKRNKLAPDQQAALDVVNELFASTEGPGLSGAVRISRFIDDQDEVAYAFQKGVFGTEREKRKHQKEALRRLSTVLFDKDIFDRSEVESEDYKEEVDIQLTQSVAEVLENHEGLTQELDALRKLHTALFTFESRSLNISLVKVTFTGGAEEGGYLDIYRFLLIEPSISPYSRDGRRIGGDGSVWVLGVETSYQE